MNGTLRLALFSMFSTLVACGGEDEQAAEAPATATPAALGIIERCSGEVRCASSGYPDVAQHFTKDGAACRLGGLELREGGDVVAEGSTGDATWKATADGFLICTDGGCLSCTGTAPAPPPPPAARTTEMKKGTCSGSAGACSNRAAGSCSSLEGCQFRQHSRFRSAGELVLEYACEGTADACSSRKTVSSCTSHGSCTWD